MRTRVFAAAFVVALASVAAGGAQATVVLTSPGAPVGGWVDPSTMTNISIEVGPGALTYMPLPVGFDPQTFGSEAPPPALAKVSAAPAMTDRGPDKTPVAVTDATILQAALGAKADDPKGANAAHTETLGGIQTKAAAAPDPAASSASSVSTAFAVSAKGDDGPLVDLRRPGLPTILVPPELIAVPEPASWILMLVGFGGLGAMLRRQRSERWRLAAVRA